MNLLEWFHQRVGKKVKREHPTQGSSEILIKDTSHAAELHRLEHTTPTRFKDPEESTPLTYSESSKSEDDDNILGTVVAGALLGELLTDFSSDLGSDTGSDSSWTDSSSADFGGGGGFDGGGSSSDY